MPHTIKSFFKFGSHENLLDLYENGTIYMNPIQYFRKIEDKNLRGDKYEGASQVINSLPGTFEIPGIDRTFRYEKVHLIKSYPVVLGNLYCLYAVSSHGFSNPLDFKMDERNMEFGTHCLMIKNLPDFFSRVERGLKKNKLKYHHGFVRYYDTQKTSKELSVFDKPLEFEYQKEFRFYVHNDKVEPIKINIGSLRDSTELHPIVGITTLKIVPAND